MNQGADADLTELEISQTGSKNKQQLYTQRKTSVFTNQGLAFKDTVRVTVTNPLECGRRLVRRLSLRANKTEIGPPDQPGAPGSHLRDRRRRPRPLRGTQAKPGSSGLRGRGNAGPAPSRPRTFPT